MCMSHTYREKDTKRQIVFKVFKLANEVQREFISRASCLKMELQADKPKAFSILHVCISWCYTEYVDHAISSRMHCRPINHLIIVTGLQKRHFYQQLGNSPFVYDSSVHFERQIKGRCNAASVAALILEDMQTFPQSANGNRLFPDNRAPSWEILSSKSNSSLLVLLQDEEPLLWAGNKCQDTFILKWNALLIFKSKPYVWESWFEKHTIWWEKLYLQ